MLLFADNLADAGVSEVVERLVGVFEVVGSVACGNRRHCWGEMDEPAWVGGEAVHYFGSGRVDSRL